MEKKLIAIDLDGTTLRSDQKIAQHTEEVIGKIQDLGHIVMISTGRPYRTSHFYYDQLKLKSPIVNFNGAYCHYPNQPDWEKAYHRTLPADVVNELFRMKDNSKVNLVSAEVDDRVYTSSRYIPYPDFFPKGPENALHFEDHPITRPATCVNVFTKDKYLQRKLEKEIIEEYGNFVEVRTWGGFAPCVEIVATGVQKAMGVEQVANYYKIKQENILAFGDEDNDYEMIQYAGLGVAMKNGILELKKIADDVTDFSNDEDGLARYLEKYFNL